MSSEEKRKLSEKDLATSSEKKFKLSEDNDRSIVFKPDGNYKFQEVPLEKNESPLAFSPAYFLRTHSKNNDPADVQTQVSRYFWFYKIIRY